jgi:hypothetical protein
MELIWLRIGTTLWAVVCRVINICVSQAVMVGVVDELLNQPQK